MQALTSTNDSYKYLRDPTIDGDVEIDAIKSVQTNREKVTMSNKEDPKESKDPGYDGDKDQLEEDQEEDTGELNEETNNNAFYIENYLLASA